MFAAVSRAIDPRSDGVERRRLVFPESVQRAVRNAARRMGLEVTTAMDSSDEKAGATAGSAKIITPQMLNTGGRGVTNPFDAM